MKNENKIVKNGKQNDKFNNNAGLIWFILWFTSPLTLYIAYKTSCSVKIFSFFVLGLFLPILILSLILKKSEKNDLKKVEETKEKMKELVNPNLMYERLGIDVLSITVNKTLVPLIDPASDGEFLPKTAALRQELTDELGFIIPNVRIMDNTRLNNNEYNIYIRGICAETGIVYPDRVMVTKKDWDKVSLDSPKDVIIGINPINKKEVYWFKAEDIKEITEIKKQKPDDVILSHFKQTVIAHAYEVITFIDVMKLCELVKTQNHELSDNLVPSLLSVADLKNILTNLIREEVAIKDIIYIFEQLNDCARFSNVPDVLSEKLRYALRRQIQQKYLNNDKIHAISFDKEDETQIEKVLLKNSVEDNDYFKNLYDAINSSIENANLNYDIKPIVLVSSKIRLALFRRLAEYNNQIHVVAYKELSPTIYVKTINKIHLEENVFVIKNA